VHRRGERGRELYVRRIDEHEPVHSESVDSGSKSASRASLPMRSPWLSSPPRSAVFLRLQKVSQDHALEELGLAVTGTAEDMAVLEADLFRYLERHRQLE